MTCSLMKRHAEIYKMDELSSPQIHRGKKYSARRKLANSKFVSYLATLINKKLPMAAHVTNKSQNIVLNSSVQTQQHICCMIPFV